MKSKVSQHVPVEKSQEFAFQTMAFERLCDPLRKGCSECTPLYVTHGSEALGGFLSNGGLHELRDP